MNNVVTIDTEDFAFRLVNGEYIAPNKNIIQNKYNNSLVVETKFVNLTTHYLVVGFRDGTTAIISPVLCEHPIGNIVIGHSKRNYTGEINVIPAFASESEYIGNLRESLVNSNNKFIYWEEMITDETLLANVHGVYVTSADVIITLAERKDIMSFHPFSKHAVHNRESYIWSDYTSKNDVIITLKLINNNEHRTACLYAVMEDKVLVLIPKKSLTLSTGIYITGLPESDVIEAPNFNVKKIYSIDDALEGKCPIKIFETALEAKAHLSNISRKGAEESIINKEHEILIANIKREVEELKHKNILLAQEYSQQETEQQKMLDKKQQEILQIKEKAAVEAAKFKSFTETTKLVSTGIGFAIMIYKILF